MTSAATAARPRFADSAPDRVLVLACGALAHEIIYLIRHNGWTHLDLECLPSRLHNTPDQITPAVASRLETVAPRYHRILVGYADCGTGGDLDRMLEGWDNVERLPGAHCYEFFAGSDVFHRLHEAEPGTFYLTDFLARHFDRLVWEPLGLNRFPQLRDAYFGNYRRLVFLSQFDTPELDEIAQDAARRLGLSYARLSCGLGELADRIGRLASPPRQPWTGESMAVRIGSR